MRTFRDAKLLAKSLRAGLARKAIELSHGACLDLVAQQFECDNWNVLSAKIEAESQPDAQQTLPIPQGWVRAGSRPDLYLMGLDTAVRHHDRPTAVIRCVLREEAARSYDKDPGFGTLMQTIKAQAYRGQRLRLRAALRTEAALSVQMWLRIDSKFTRGIRFDNMDNRPLRGSHEWTTVDIVLQVPEEAEQVSYGFFVTGTGAAWASGFALEVVGRDVEETGSAAVQVLEAPTNLDFSLA
ncbi:MAG TPA: glyoxalase superfamily protein [Chitinolyticbacter sp.]|nr:glyoxalase superfamily protein [Chitinolyticbacter sp.]